MVTLFRVRDDLFFERRIDGANQLVVPFRHLPRDRERERERDRQRERKRERESQGTRKNELERVCVYIHK